MLRSEADFNFPITYNEQYKLTKTHKGCGLPLRGLVVTFTLTRTCIILVFK